MALIDATRFALNAPGQVSRGIGSALLGGQQLQQAAATEAALQQQELTRGLQEQAATAESPMDRRQALARMSIQAPEQFQQVAKSMGMDTKQKQEEAADFAFRLKSVPFEQREQLINERITKLQAEGRNPSDTQQLLGMPIEQQDQALDVVQMLALSPQERMDIARGGKAGVPAEIQAFRELVTTADLSEAQKREAALIKLGLQPRAMGSAIQTIAAGGLAEQVGDAEATIAQRKKFGELTGSSRSKAIDSGFERIVKIDEGLNNLDRAIELIRGGAGTGAISQYLPSFKAASIELDNLRNTLALDVIGGVTLGAISEAELDLVKQVALPVGLEGEPLIAHLEERKRAQQKLRAYFQEQIEFLDQGGTVAGFLRMKEKQIAERKEQPQTGDMTGFRQPARRIEEIPASELGNLSDEELRALAGQ